MAQSADSLMKNSSHSFNLSATNAAKFNIAPARPRTATGTAKLAAVSFKTYSNGELTPSGNALTNGIEFTKNTPQTAIAARATNDMRTITHLFASGKGIACTAGAGAGGAASAGGFELDIS